VSLAYALQRNEPFDHNLATIRNLDVDDSLPQLAAASVPAAVARRGVLSREQLLGYFEETRRVAALDGVSPRTGGVGAEFVAAVLSKIPMMEVTPPPP
jgi:hypothetical protein